MSNKLKLSTKDESLREILSNGKKYFVPRFQRDYSWVNEHWEILWEDISLIRKGEEDAHYMGYLVLQESEQNGNYKIIDGQQRLTTFSLLVLAAIKRLKNIGDEEAEERAKELHSNFIGTRDIVSLKDSNKITLNRNNDFYYREVVQGNDLPKTNKKQTVILMGKALEYFYGVLKDETGEDISKIIDTISQKLFFTTIYIGNELNAYKVFETLNARGVQLSSSDLLKNYIFSLIDKKGDMSDDVLTNLEDKWGKIGDNLGNNPYTDYILCEWNSKHKLVRKASLFKNIRTEINTSEQADKYLTALHSHSELYSALLDPYNDFWKDHEDYDSIKNDLSVLKLFGIIQPRSLLFISYKKHGDDFAKVLNWIKVFSFRYNAIGGKHTGEQEGLYNNMCLMIAKGCKLKDIKAKLFELYPQDDEFEPTFSNKTMLTSQSNKKVRYILARLAEQVEHQKDLAIDETGLTVEHILPLNPDEKWCNEFGDNWQNFNQRIGNMALVSKSENQHLAQKSFQEKKAILKKSIYEINRINDYDEWDAASVESRQKALAKIAVKVWRIN